MNIPSFQLRATVCSLLIAGGLLFRPSPAEALVIDNFSQGPLAPIQGTNTAQFGTTVVQTGLNPASVLGGTRAVYVGSLSLATASVDTTKGRFHFSADNSYGYFKLDWGSVSPLNINLSAGGNNRFHLEFVDVTPNVPLNLFSLRVKSGNNWFNYDIGNDFTAALHGGMVGPLTVPFAKFAGADFTQVQAIELDAGRVPSGFRLAIDSISVVPEPSTAALLGIVLGAGLLTRRPGYWFQRGC